MEVLSLDVQRLRHALEQSFSANAALRKEAEQQLQQVSHTRGLLLMLLQIVQHAQVEIDVRVAAAVMLKNEVRAYWEEEEEDEEEDEEEATTGGGAQQQQHCTYDAEEKQAVKSALYAALLHATPVSQPLALQLVECVRLVALHDFPYKWKDLLPVVVAEVAERRDPVRLRAALLVLQQLFGCFSYRRSNHQEETLKLLVSSTWSLLLPAAAQLLREGGAAHGEAMELLKAILKIFRTAAHACHVAAPLLLSSFDDWMQLLEQILLCPVPAALVAGVEVGERGDLPIYKVKKWVLTILQRCFSRAYGEQQLLRRRRRHGSRRRAGRRGGGGGVDEEEEAALAEEALTRRFATVWGPRFTEQLLLLLRRQHAEQQEAAAAAAGAVPGAAASPSGAVPAAAGAPPGAVPAAAAAVPGAAEVTWWLSPRMQNSILQIFLECVSSAQLYSRFIKPNGEFLALNTCLSLLHFSHADEELWDADPLEFIRRDNDGIESVYDPREAAAEFLRGLVRLRGREFLEPLYLCMHRVAADFTAAEAAAAAAKRESAAAATAGYVATAGGAAFGGDGSMALRQQQQQQEQQQQQVLLPAAAYQQMDAALRLACCMGERLTSKKRQVPVEVFLNEYVLPLLQHWHKFLRLRACRVYEQYVQQVSNAGSSHKALQPQQELLLVPAYHRLLLLLRDSELPVRVAAAVALRSFLLLPADDPPQQLQQQQHAQQQLLPLGLQQQQHLHQHGLSPSSSSSSSSSLPFASQRQQLRQAVILSLGDLTEALFSLLEVVDSEAVLRTVEELAVSYSKEIIPHAKNLVKGLAAALRHALVHAQRAAAVDDAGAEEDAAGAAEAVVNALENVLQAVAEAPAVFTELSEDLCSIFELLLSPGQEEYLEEGLLLLSYVTYYMPPPFPPRLWRLFECMHVGICCSGKRRSPLFAALLSSPPPAAAPVSLVPFPGAAAGTAAAAGPAAAGIAAAAGTAAAGACGAVAGAAPVGTRAGEAEGRGAAGGEAQRGEEEGEEGVDDVWLLSAEQVVTPLINFIVRDPHHFLQGRSIHTGLSYKEQVLQIAKSCIDRMHDTEDACVGVQLLCAMISSSAGQQIPADDVLLPSFEMVWNLLLRQHAAAQERQRRQAGEKTPGRAAGSAAEGSNEEVEAADADTDAAMAAETGAAPAAAAGGARGEGEGGGGGTGAAIAKKEEEDTPILDSSIKRIFIKFISSLLVYDVQKTFAILEQLQLSSQIFNYLLNNASAAETAEQKKLLLVGLTRVLQLVGAAAAGESASAAVAAAPAGGGGTSSSPAPPSLASPGRPVSPGHPLLPPCVGLRVEQLVRVVAAAAAQQQQLLQKLRAAAAANSSDCTSDSEADSEQDLAEDEDAEINPKTKELLERIDAAKKWEEEEENEGVGEANEEGMGKSEGHDTDTDDDWEEAFADEFDPSTSALRTKLLENVEELPLLRETLSTLPQQLQQMISTWLGQQHLLKLKEVLAESPPPAAPPLSTPSQQVLPL